MDDSKEFQKRNAHRIQKMADDAHLTSLSLDWMLHASEHEYSYHFSWLGRPIIQYPQDIVALQELIWEVKPDLIIETGIARGGSLIFYASMLELLRGDGIVVGVDIDIRQHNRLEIENHFLSSRIRLVEGSSIAEGTVKELQDLSIGRRRVLVALDSNHTYSHVIEELAVYSKFVTKGSYLIVFDTIIEYMPTSFSCDRQWTVGNNPAIAVCDFLSRSPEFVVDKALSDKLKISAAPGGYLRRI